MNLSCERGKTNKEGISIVVNSQNLQTNTSEVTECVYNCVIRSCLVLLHLVIKKLKQDINEVFFSSLLLEDK